MPSLKAFGRRWHTASDTLPLLGAFLGTYHIAWVVAYQLSAADLDTSGFRSDACGQKPIFSTCYIGVFTIFGVAAIAEFSIAGIGLRGGPLEVSKRRAIRPFIHLMPALWLLLLVWTILGTYIVASPNINPACWEENPCLYEQVADRCISINGTKPTNITPACQTLFREFGDATECWAGWLGVGQNWTRLHRTCPPAIDPYVTSGFDYILRKYDLEVVTTVPGNLTLLEQVELLKELNITYDPEAVSESAPWFHCLDPTCEPLLRAADDCRQIDILINLMPPQSSSPKHFFEALIYTCWATLAITGIVAYMAFNSFPELDTIESWEGTLKGMARTFCCGSLLEVEAAAGEGGSGPASKEIAKSLLALFGGIDLDPTDRLLGLYLVSEQQSRRRRNHLLRVLTEAGIQEVPNSPGLVRRTLQSITKMSQQRRRGPPAGSQTTASPQLSIDDTILPANGRASPAAAAGLHGVQLVAAGIPELQEQQLPVQQQQLGNGFASSNSPAVQQLPQIAEDSFTLRPSPFSQPSMTAQSPQSTLQADLEAPPGSPPTSHAAAISATAMVRPSPYSQGAILTLPPSPYSQGAAIAPSPHSQGAGPAADSPVQRTGSEVRRNWRQMLPVYRQTMLRLRTAAMVELRPAGGTAGGTGGTYSRGSRTAGGMDRTANQAFGGMTDDSDSGSGASSPTACGVRFPPGEEQAQLDSGGMPQPPPTGETDCLPTLELLRPRFSPAAPGGSGGTAVGTPTAGGTGDGTAGSTPTAAGGLGRRGGGREVGIRVAASYRPMLTPSGCISKLSIAPREAADLCSGYHDPVPKPVVEEADKIRRFAVGAYGLQSLLWAKGRPKPMCFGNMNMLLKCLGRPLRLDSKFRKNNFNAIMQITGAQPGDLLYVSYANAPGGVLPYMLMLDRASKSVVLAVRGTVSMQDLVTDLLSTSVDVAGWMPDWVCQANKAGEGMFAHMGIVSSATAILKDLEDNDLLQELCSRVGVSPDKAGLSPRRDRVSNQGSESRSSNGGKGSGGGGGINPASKPPAGPAGSRPANGRPPAGRAGGAPSAGSIASAASSRAGAAGVPPATAALLRQGGLAERLMSWHEAHYSQQLPSMGSMAPHRQSQAASEDAGEAEEDVGGEVVHGFGQETRVEVLPQGDAAGRMPDIGAMQPDAEVRLPLSRAKTIIRGKVQEEGWQVVVTGHSLGAAVACLLGFHLREVFPDLRCWCFNPPGGLLSWNLSVLAQPFCTSVVVGKDVISRLSFNTSRRVVDEMVLTLARCKRPKLLVLMDMLLKRWRNPGNTLCALTEISDDAVRVLEGYYRSSFLHASDQTDMYPPGRLLFLRPFKGQKKRKVVWDAVWVDAQALMGEGILLAPSMLAHHRLFVVEEALQSVLRDEAEQLPTDGKVGVV